MTGRIKSLSPGNGYGLITTDSGIRVRFLASAVLEYDVTCLAVGQMVNFELDVAGVPTAVNVSVQRQHKPGVSPGKLPEAIPLRYIGFRQAGTMREYRFERIRPGEPTETLVVSVDMALFRKHRVGIQEGPGICLRAIEGGLSPADLKHTLTDQHLLAYLASRPAPRPRPRHVPPPRHRVAAT